MNDLFTRSWDKPTKLSKDVQLQDLETGQGAPSRYTEEFSAKELATFNGQSKVIKQEIMEVNRSIDQMESLYGESKAAVQTSEIQRIRKQMQVDLENIHSAAKSIKSKLEALVRENEENTRKPGCEENSATWRQRANITRGLGTNLRSAVERLTALRSRMEAEHRDTVERRVDTVTGTRPSPDEVDQLIKTGESEEIFQRAVQSQGRRTALAAKAEMQERHDAVKELTRDLVLLHQIFQDMAAHVEAQGDLVDDIGDNVKKALEHAEKAAKELKVAVDTKLNTRLWQLFGWMVLVGILTAVFAAVALQQFIGPSNSKTVAWVFLGITGVLFVILGILYWMRRSMRK